MLQRVIFLFGVVLACGFSTAETTTTTTAGTGSDTTSVTIDGTSDSALHPIKVEEKNDLCTGPQFFKTVFDVLKGDTPCTFLTFNLRAGLIFPFSGRWVALQGKTPSLGIQSGYALYENLSAKYANGGIKFFLVDDPWDLDWVFVKGISKIFIHPDSQALIRVDEDGSRLRVTFLDHGPVWIFQKYGDRWIIVEIISVSGKSTIYERNTSGFLLAVRYPNGKVTTVAYANGMITKITVERDRTYIYEFKYDGRNYLVALDRDGGGISGWDYYKDFPPWPDKLAGPIAPLAPAQGTASPSGTRLEGRGSDEFFRIYYTGETYSGRIVQANHQWHTAVVNGSTYVADYLFAANGTSKVWRYELIPNGQQLEWKLISEESFLRDKFGNRLSHTNAIGLKWEWTFKEIFPGLAVVDYIKDWTGATKRRIFNGPHVVRAEINSGGGAISSRDVTATERSFLEKTVVLKSPAGTSTVQASFNAYGQRLSSQLSQNTTQEVWSNFSGEEIVGTAGMAGGVLRQRRDFTANDLILLSESNSNVKVTYTRKADKTIASQTMVAANGVAVTIDYLREDSNDPKRVTALRYTGPGGTKTVTQ